MNSFLCHAPDNRRSLGVVILLAACLFPLLGGCGHKKSPPPPPPRSVTTVRVEQRDVPLYIEAIGKCTALRVVSIQPQVSGQLMEVHFTQGQEVRKDSPLFTIDPRPYKASLDKAEANLANDRAQLQLKEAQLRRSRDLVSGDYISPQDIESLEAAVASAKAQVQADLASVDTARINLDFCSIRAPVDGRTGILLVDIGNIVSPAASNSLVSLQTLDPIYVDFVIVEKDLPAVQKYAAVAPLKVEISLVEDAAFQRIGELFVVDNAVTKGTGTVKLRALLQNRDRALWPEQFVNVRLILDTIKGALLVPSEAIKTGQNGPFIFVVKADSSVDLRRVKVGQSQGEQTVVLHGVRADERVVVTGQMMLSPGTKVIEAGKNKSPTP